MTDTTDGHDDNQSMPMHNDSPFYGYDVDAIQEQYALREAPNVAAFFLPHLKPGMKVLDCGCGPGTITQGLARAVAPGEVVGCDLEPGMVARAAALAEPANLPNLTFQTGDILNLPFEDNTFDAALSCAVTEHLSEPVKAMSELRRVVKRGGVVGITRTDWSDPMVSPPCDALTRFFELFERGFRLQGGSMNTGRHLGAMLREAGLTVIDMFGAYSNASTPEAVNNMAGGWAEWIENLPLFDRAIEEGWVERAELDDMAAEIRAWVAQPGAFCATAGCRAVARKD